MLIRRDEVIEVHLGPKYKFNIGDKVMNPDPYWGREVGEVRRRSKRKVVLVNRGGVNSSRIETVYDVMYRHHVTTLTEESIIKV